MAEESVVKFFRHAPSPARRKLAALLGAACVTLSISFYCIFKIATHDPRAVPEIDISHAAVPPAEVLPDFTFTYELRPLSMPLTDRRHIRTAYAQFNLVFDLPSKDAIHHMELHRAKLVDVVLEVAGQFTIEDFQTPMGYETFKGTLKGRYRQLFGQFAPREIALRDWLLH